MHRIMDSAPFEIPVLRTDRFELHPIEEAHAEVLFPLMREERLTRFLAWGPHANVEETRAVLQSLARAQVNGTGYHWTIFEGAEARGVISLIDVRRKHRLWTLNRAEVAYWVDVNHHGHGIATEAARAVVYAGFTILGLNRLTISHTSTNPASGKIPQALGFRFVGTEHEFFSKNGVLYDMNHYEMLSKDWTLRR